MSEVMTWWVIPAAIAILWALANDLERQQK